jgi:hypothetical protein
MGPAQSGRPNSSKSGEKTERKRDSKEKRAAKRVVETLSDQAPGGKARKSPKEAKSPPVVAKKKTGKKQSKKQKKQGIALEALLAVSQNEAARQATRRGSSGQTAEPGVVRKEQTVSKTKGGKVPLLHPLQRSKLPSQDNSARVAPFEDDDLTTQVPTKSSRVVGLKKTLVSETPSSSPLFVLEMSPRSDSPQPESSTEEEDMSDSSLFSDYGSPMDMDGLGDLGSDSLSQKAPGNGTEVRPYTRGEKTLSKLSHGSRRSATRQR